MKSTWVPTMALAGFLALAASSPALAGWMIREADPEFPEEVTTYWFQNGKVRVEGALEGLTILIDMRREEGYLVDAPAKRYAGGKLSEISEQLKKLEMNGVPVEEASEEAGAAPATEVEAFKPGAIEVKDAGAGERVLGYETRRYQVRIDGDLLEELLVAPKLTVQEEVDLAAFAATMQKMLGGGMNQGYETSPEYRAVGKNGYPVRQTLHFVGEKSTVEVTKAEAGRFPEADFALPPGLAKIGYVELLIGMEE